RTDRRERDQVLAYLGRRLDGRGARRLGILLDRLETGEGHLPQVAFLPSSGSHFEGGGLREEMGRVWRLHRSFLRPVARSRSTCRRHLRDALLALSGRQF